MAEAVSVEFEGISAVVAKLKSLQPQLEQALINGASQGTAIVGARAIDRCPVDTGNLRRSISMRRAYLTDELTATGYVIAKAFYAMYVEFGTGVRGKGSYKYKLGRNISYDPDWPGMIAQPFLYPSIIESRQAVYRVVEKAVRAALKGS